METKKRGSFGGSLGFVLAAAGSAVGLGNIWRFPYLAARDGGGLFLIIYLVLALTFGYALLTTEVAIGRKTKQSPLTAYSKLKDKWGGLGVISCIIPFMIMPYYVVIGGWVLKYFITFLTGHGADAATDTFFTDFIAHDYEPIIMMAIFLFACAFIIYKGVSGGIENTSKILMPILIILVIGIAIFSLTIKDTSESGKIVTGLDGLKVYLIPSLKGITVKKFFYILTDATGQLFYSLSIAMGIMIAYGSYVPDDTNLSKSITNIEIFDTMVAFLAGIMIIPTVFVFQGRAGLKASGPSLMFVALPKVFMEMGDFGNIVGTIFFAMVLFAALTSAISIMEAVVSSMIDKTKIERKHATIVELIFALIIAIIVCLGYNKLYFEFKLPNGSKAQILDILDYVSNYILMPVVEIGTCILVGWILKPQMIIEEVTKNGEKFSRKTIYTVMIKFLAPVLLVILLLIALGIL